MSEKRGIRKGILFFCPTESTTGEGGMLNGYDVKAV